MKNNKVTIIVSAILLIVVIIVLAYLCIYNNKSEKELENNIIIYKCTSLVDENDNFNNYNVITLNVKDGIVQNETTSTRFEFKSAEYFNMLNQNETFMQNKTSNTKDLIITWIYKEVDYTKDEENNSKTISYEEYEATLEDNDYSCEKE